MVIKFWPPIIIIETRHSVTACILSLDTAGLFLNLNYRALKLFWIPNFFGIFVNPNLNRVPESA